MENKVKIWLARDEKGSLWAYSGVPFKDDDDMWFSDKPQYEINSSKFPSVKWEDDEPTEAYITLANMPQPKKEIDWEQRRYEIAKDLYVRWRDMDAKWAVHATDSLINELKNKTK